MAAHWLVKQEPSAYSWTDLETEGETEWNGVHNALALRHLRSMAVGDLALFYHSGSERACVGLLTVVRGPVPDPDDARGSFMVRVRALRRLRRPIPLSEIREDPTFDGFDLVRISRLSVMPVTPRQWDRLMSLESSETPSARISTARSSGRVRATRRPPRARAARRRR